jgi:hypothetical protein
MKTIVTIVVLAFLIIPACLFAFLKFRPKNGLLLICFFVILLPTTLSLFSRAKNHELFAGTIGQILLDPLQYTDS